MCAGSCSHLMFWLEPSVSVNRVVVSVRRPASVRLPAGRRFPSDARPRFARSPRSSAAARRPAQAGVGQVDADAGHCVRLNLL
jgi:hypothetical protein